MKKVVSLAVAGATLAGAAFADVSFGAWGRGNWVLAANQYDSVADETNVVMGQTQSWTNKGPRVGLSVSGDAGTVGFAFDIFNNGDAQGQGDNAFVWAKPIEQVKISLGKMDDNTLRGDACFGLWNTLRYGVQKGFGRQESEGFTFMHTHTGGAIVTVTPIENLTAMACMNFNFTNDTKDTWALGTGDAGVKIQDVLGIGSKYAVAYTIPETATIKLGVEEKGAVKVTETKYLNVINASVEVTAIENAYFAIGAFIPTVGVKDDGEATHVNLYGNYQVNDQLKAHLKVGTAISEIDAKEGKDDAFGFLGEVGLDYAINDTLSAYLDVGYANGVYAAKTSADNSDCLTIGAGLFKGLGNGKIGVSFVGATNNYGFYAVEADKFAWAVPVTMEFWF